MSPSTPPLVPLPRSYAATGTPFPVGSFALSAAPEFLAQLRAVRAEIEETFGATVLSPLSSVEEFAWSEKHAAEGSELWGGNFRPSSAPSVSLALLLEEDLPSGAYAVRSADSGIRLSASSPEGAAAACAVFVQLLHFSWDGWRFVLPACAIDDAPAYSWRGLMVDSSRHFIPVAALERIVRLAWLYRIDRLHWHLSDDQGWRVELLNAPSATGAGSTRPGGDPNRNGFYAHEEVRSIVAFAADRGITVVPELDLPGHVQAVLAGRPDLACRSGPHEVRTMWGISEDVLCMGNPASLEFALAAWDEVCGLFPGPFVHIGGDECPTTRWESCPRCAERKAALGLRDWVDLHGDFVARVAAHLAGKGKKVFGWDEVLDSAVPNPSNVFHWRAWLPEKSAEALAAGRDLVRSPCFPYYLDFVQDEDRAATPGLAYKTPHAATLRRVYEFDPTEGLPADPSGRGPGKLLGVQANAWSEYLRDPRRIDYMLFPRLLALAETGWLGADKPGWADFRSRLDGQRRVLDRLAVNYCPVEFER